MDDARRGRAYAAAPTLYVVLFFVLPVVALAAYAVGRGDRDAWETLQRIATTPYYTNRIAFTFQQAALSTFLTLAAGLPLAWLFSHCQWPGRRFLRAAFTAPFVLPALVVALALQAWIGPDGLLGLDLLTPMGPLGSILLAHVFYNVSLVLRIVGNQWERLPDAYGEAAQTLGARPAVAALRVELALLRPSILVAALLTFLFTFTSFGIILLLGGPRTGTLETLIFEELRSFRPDYATAAALALLQLLVTFAALFLFARWQRRLTSRWPPKAHATRRQLPAWGYPTLAVAVLLLLGPPAALAAASLHTHQGWGLHAYAALLGETVPLGSYTLGQAALNSVRFALLTLVIALPLGALAALSAHRGQAAVSQTLLLLPLGLSSVVVGLGFLLAWNGTLLPDLRANGAWIVLAHTLIAFPFAARVLLPALDAVEPRIREAAQTLGAAPQQVLARVDFPLTYPALGVAAVFAFASSLGEFGAALILRRPETTTIPLAIFDAAGRPGPIFRETALALATILLLVAVASFLLLERARVRTWGEFA